jgi:hypothetical protein
MGLRAPVHGIRFRPPDGRWEGSCAVPPLGLPPINLSDCTRVLPTSPVEGQGA